MLIMLKPPLIKPTRAEAKAINLLEMPALFIIDPAKINDMRDEVERVYGKKYLSPSVRAYGPKGSSQDAHEAIRPTYDNANVSMRKEEKKLLNLI